MYDIIISGQHCSIQCMASRWTTDNFSVIFETWIKKSDIQALNNSIRPGAVKELFNILGLPHYCDTSYTGANTIRIIPNPSSSSTIASMRKETIIYPKTVTIETVEGDKQWLNLKLDAYISSTSEL